MRIDVATLTLTAEGRLFETDQQLTEATGKYLKALAYIVNAQGGLFDLTCKQTFTETDDPTACAQGPK